MGFKETDPSLVEENFLKLLNENWALLSAGNPERFNMMTVSSGAIGNFFRKNIVYAYVRPGRYTRELMDSSEYFTLSFFKEEYKPQLTICGRTSGRDTDKVKETGLTPVFTLDGAPYFEEAQLVYICRKIYTEETDPARFLDKTIEEWYPHKDYHLVYVGEILKVLQKETNE